MAYSITRTITDTKIFKDADTAIDNYNFNKDMKCDDVMIKIDHDDRGFTVTQSFTRTIEVKWDKDKLDAIMLRSKEREINNENRVRTVEVIDVIEL